MILAIRWLEDCAIFHIHHSTFIEKIQALENFQRRDGDKNTAPADQQEKSFFILPMQIPFICVHLWLK